MRSAVVAIWRRGLFFADGLQARARGSRVSSAVFIGTFLAAWFLLDSLVTSPPTLVSALVAVGVSARVVVLGQVGLGVPRRQIFTALGLGRPKPRAVVTAGIVGATFFVSLLLGARAVGVTLELREDWPAVFTAALIFHGLAEELVWRGFVFGRLQRSTTFLRAVAKSMPLIAITHVSMTVSNGLTVGLLATATAAVTCLPFGYLWERGGRTVWAPALLHGFIGSWQLFERTYPIQFSVVTLVASIAVPMLVFLCGNARSERHNHVPARGMYVKRM